MAHMFSVAWLWLSLNRYCLLLLDKEDRVYLHIFLFTQSADFSSIAVVAVSAEIFLLGSTQTHRSFVHTGLLIFTFHRIP
jgi:hypothetical protein